LAEEAVELLPLYLAKEGVVAIGEIGYDDQTEAEDRIFKKQLELALELEMPVMIHTPHRDKKRGTYRSMDAIEDVGVDPGMVVIDHNNEETVADPLAVYKTRRLMQESGIPQDHIDAVCYSNALAAYGQSGQMNEEDWLNPQPIDQRQLFKGNSVLRGGQVPRVDDDSLIIE
jgi:hypothetical protein